MGRAAALLLGLVVLATCAFAAGRAGEKATAPDRTRERASAAGGEPAKQIDPSAWRLSPEAEHLYYYLVLAGGIADNSREEISIALRALLRLDPSLEVYQDSATIMLSRGDFDGTRTLALEGLDKFPGDNLLTLLLSAAYSETGQTAGAIALLEKHIANNAADEEAVQELIRLYINSGQAEKAGILFSRLPETDMSAEAERFRAGVLATTGRVAEARAILRELLANQPDNFEAWMELADLHARDKKPEEAIEAYRKAAGLMPDNPDLQFRLASLYIEQKRPAEALQYLNAAPLLPHTGMQVVLRLADAGYYKEAEEVLKRADGAGGDPEQRALILSMLRQENAGNPLEGLAPLKSIKPSSPMYPIALQQKARIYIAVGDYAKAHAVAFDGRRRYPEHKELWGLEAYALVKRNKSGEAEALLAESLRQYPDDEELLFFLGSVQDEIGKKDAAMQTMEHILTLRPDNYQALNYVGYTLAEENRDLDRALALVTAALQQCPDADYIVDSLAWVQYRLGRFDDAWESITRCISLGGNEAAMWEHYGDIALALGKTSEANKGYTEAIARRPDNIVEVRKKLAALKK